MYLCRVYYCSSVYRYGFQLPPNMFHTLWSIFFQALLFHNPAFSQNCENSAHSMVLNQNLVKFQQCDYWFISDMNVRGLISFNKWRISWDLGVLLFFFHTDSCCSFQQITLFSAIIEYCRGMQVGIILISEYTIKRCYIDGIYIGIRIWHCCHCSPVSSCHYQSPLEKR